MKRIPTLDGWRGIAVLLVLADHVRFALHAEASPGVATGQHGVTIFFVLSGFLITSKLMEEKNATGSIDLRSFYLRRFFRLMPAAWVFLLLAAIGAVISDRSATAARGIFSSLFFWRNYAYLFGPDHGLTGHFWSLSIEEQFYLVWPFLMVIAGRRAIRWVAVTGAVAIALYRFVSWDRLIQLPLWKICGTHLRADALLIGCVAALFLPLIKTYLRAWMALPLLAALIACFIHYRALIPASESLTIAALLLVTSQCRTAVFQVLDWKPLAFLGTISYGVYLWQQLFMLEVYGGGSVYLSFAFFAGAVATSYLFIEKPLMERGRMLTRRKALISGAPEPVEAAQY